METDESNGCCRDEIKVLKLVLDQNKLPVVTYEIPAFEIKINTPSEFIVALFQNIDEQRHFHNHSPPLLSEQGIYLQNNVFRI